MNSFIWAWQRVCVEEQTLPYALPRQAILCWWGEPNTQKGQIPAIGFYTLKELFLICGDFEACEAVFCVGLWAHRASFFDQLTKFECLKLLSALCVGLWAHGASFF